MKKELLEFINKNNLSCFSKSNLSFKSEPVLKTRDAKQVYSKVLTILSSYFYFHDSRLLWQNFEFTSLEGETIKRQDYWKSISKQSNKFLEGIKIPRNWWKPKYGVIVATEDEASFIELQKLQIPVQFISTEEDVRSLEEYDIVQVLDCENFSQLLESLPQSVFLDSSDEAYLERYLETLSGWKENLELLYKNETNEEISRIVLSLIPLLEFLGNKTSSYLSRDTVEEAVEKINLEISEKIKQLSISGADLLEMLNRGKLPSEFETLVASAIKSSGIPSHLLNSSIPVTIDEQELEKIIQLEKANENTNLAEKIKKHSGEISKIPEKLRELETLLMLFDFNSGVSKLIENFQFYPQVSEDFFFSDAENIFLDSPQAISFSLDSNSRCSMLTGANSGGKTTLLEHILQLVTFLQLGLPVKGSVRLPLFSEIYYFAKTKGSASKGAFETLLSDMSKIKPGNKTLILADEIEAVTEPGVAGKIICTTAEFFIKKNCFLVIATHLGQEIQKNLPCNCRIDGIEAKGINEKNELIVDHNPVLGRLANSTPELIIEKMFKEKSNEEYFQFLYGKLKKS